MAIDNNITHEPFVQSKTFKNILYVGTKMAEFLHVSAFVGDKRREVAENLVKNWRNVCGEFADDKQKDWEIIEHDESVQDVAEYLAKTKALINVILAADLSQLSADTTRDYFSEVLSLVEVTVAVFDNLL